MAYHIHHTEGIVLQTKGVHDSNVVLFVYTKDMGLVVARAISLRLHRSRLRFVLQRFSRSHIDLVRGKSGFMITSARQIDTNSDIFRHENRKISFAVLSGVLLRLIQGEEPNIDLYFDLCNLLDILKKIDSKESCFALELLSTIRILNILGYWEAVDSDSEYLGDLSNEKEILINIFKNRKLLIPRINEAFRNTNL